MIKLKNRAIALALAGAVLFTTAAAADFLAGDAYTGAKNAVKDTVAYFSDGASSGTVEAGVNVLIDSEAVMTGEFLTKVDFEAYRMESSERTTDLDDTYEYRHYEDENKNVRYLVEEDVYYVYPYGLSRDYAIINNPFEEEMAQDLEKVFDAFVGNLKEFVNSKDNGDGRLYYGELDSTQIPALPNTLAAFVTKYTFNDDYQRERYGLTYLSEIAVEGIKGSLAVDKDGIIENAEGSLTMLGFDEDGNEHTIALEGYIKLYDIDNTVVLEFDPSGKNVIEQPECIEETVTVSAYLFDERDLGTYKKDIVKVSDDSYEKTGEVKITITAVGDGEISGIYENTETEESIQFKASNFVGDSYYFDTVEDGCVIVKDFEYNEEGPCGINVYTGAVVEEGGWHSDGERYKLARSFE